MISSTQNNFLIFIYYVAFTKILEFAVWLGSNKELQIQLTSWIIELVQTSPFQDFVVDLDMTKENYGLSMEKLKEAGIVIMKTQAVSRAQEFFGILAKQLFAFKL